jgi:hypothetical protein
LPPFWSRLPRSLLWNRVNSIVQPLNSISLIQPRWSTRGTRVNAPLQVRHIQVQCFHSYFISSQLPSCTTSHLRSTCTSDMTNSRINLSCNYPLKVTNKSGARGKAVRDFTSLYSNTVSPVSRALGRDGWRNTWPQMSPDLTSLHFLLRGCVKGGVSALFYSICNYRYT